MAKHSTRTRAEKAAARDALLEAAAERRINNQTLAEILDVDPSVLSRWRRQKAVPAKNVERIWMAVGAIKNGGTCPALGNSRATTRVPPPKAQAETPPAPEKETPPRQQMMPLDNGQAIEESVRRFLSALPTELVVEEALRRSRGRR